MASTPSAQGTGRVDGEGPPATIGPHHLCPSHVDPTSRSDLTRETSWALDPSTPNCSITKASNLCRRLPQAWEPGEGPRGHDGLWVPASAPSLPDPAAPGPRSRPRLPVLPPESPLLPTWPPGNAGFSPTSVRVLFAPPPRRGAEPCPSLASGPVLTPLENPARSPGRSWEHWPSLRVPRPATLGNRGAARFLFPSLCGNLHVGGAG